MPKVTISKGERQIEVELDERTTEHVVEALRAHTVKNLIDPKTRTVYVGEVELEKQIADLGKALLNLNKN